MSDYMEKVDRKIWWLNFRDAVIVYGSLFIIAILILLVTAGECW